MNAAKNWLDKAHDLAKQCCESQAYADFLKNNYKPAERGKRAEKRSQRGCLTNDWKPDQLSAKAILVIGENGVGDEILTAGCLAELVSKAGVVTWRCDPKLKSLFARSAPRVAFISGRDPQPAVEGTIYSWELIGRFREKLGDFPWLRDGAGFTPYLNPSEPLKNSLAARYRDGSKKIVGLAWRSERCGELLSDKTCSLHDVPHWAKFFECLKDKVRFISLQYGDTQDEIAFARWKYGVEIYQDKSIDIFNDVDAAAAQIAAMNYVVSISTTAVHLAGALGVPGWVLLQKNPFGHWQAGKAICPWYPMLEPIKQTNTGDWSTVLDAAVALLHQEVNSPQDDKSTQ